MLALLSAQIDEGRHEVDSRIAGDGMKLLIEVLLAKGDEDMLVPSIEIGEESNTVER